MTPGRHIAHPKVVAQVQLRGDGVLGELLSHKADVEVGQAFGVKVDDGALQRLAEAERHAREGDCCCRLLGGQLRWLV